MEAVLSKLDDILATLDEDDANELRTALAEKEALAKEKARVERDLRLINDKDLKDRFPRAWRAYQKKFIDFGDMTDPAEIETLLKSEESKWAEMGVPINEGSPQAQAPVVAEPSSEPAPDPAEAFGTPVSGGQPSGARNLTQEFEETIKADSPTDVLRRAEIVKAMSREDKERLVDQLSAPPIIPRRGLI